MRLLDCLGLVTPSAAIAAGFSASAAATFFFGALLRLKAGEEGWRIGDLKKADGEGRVMVSMETWGNERFGLDIQAGTEGGVWSRLDVVYRKKAWRDMTGFGGDPFGCFGNFERNMPTLTHVVIYS